jgi:hypothetical protein
MIEKRVVIPAGCARLNEDGAWVHGRTPELFLPLSAALIMWGRMMKFAGPADPSVKKFEKAVLEALNVPKT